MADINTLVEDIYALFDEDSTHEVSHDNVDKLGRRIAETIAERLTPRSREDSPQRLRLSNAGTPCERKLWYTVNSPDEGEDLLPSTKIKFLFGDILELLLLFLAEESGHRVEGEQDTLEVSGIKGHRDAVIDGITVDTKSASTFSFKKFNEGKLRDDDPFGYITQLGSYVLAGRDDPRVTEKETGAFLVIDKQHGHITLDTHKFDFSDWEEKLEQTKEIVNNHDELPERPYGDLEDGKGGNRRLSTICSYCQYRNHCWPSLRTFLYSSGPRYLTVVAKEPKVPELVDGEVVIKDNDSNYKAAEGW